MKEHPDLMEEVEQKVREKYAQKEGVDQARMRKRRLIKQLRSRLRQPKRLTMRNNRWKMRN